MKILAILGCLLLIIGFIAGYELASKTRHEILIVQEAFTVPRYIRALKPYVIQGPLIIDTPFAEIHDSLFYIEVDELEYVLSIQHGVYDVVISDVTFNINTN